MSNHMKFEVIKYSDVQYDIEGQKLDFHDELNTQKFNTSSYRWDYTWAMNIPSELPYSFQRWLPLILASRSLSPSDVQTVTLGNPEVCLLEKIAKTSVTSREIDGAYEDKVKEKIAPLFSTLEFPPQGLFMQLNTCSTKDGVPGLVGGALCTVKEVILQLVTSKKALNAFSWHLQDRTERLFYYGSPFMTERHQASFEVWHSSQEPLQLFLLPFDDRMKQEREYRVFCPPAWRSSKYTPKITAISQRKWDEPWLLANMPLPDMKQWASKILAMCDEIRERILKELDHDNMMDLCML
ncbi:uncharacterized protein F4807DRAFT_168231 [Annulohypoxylon truncatum]|uniref:uncharacterized protein n=1 Tax=Annulohypoxylon truncatum TaxID=327061 RepID=UPI002007D17A|nr:uncharacterized protein F4807DRAFT_168231 [Annulohypoxylon truncatum]KAI1207842.1 hypothetical protein F4807DRAFT_168231 [Annulohypoxylon truncatum]